MPEPAGVYKGVRRRGEGNLNIHNARSGPRSAAIRPRTRLDRGLFPVSESVSSASRTRLSPVEKSKEFAGPILKVELLFLPFGAQQRCGEAVSIHGLPHDS